jgi:hypothetical protein
MRSPFVPVVVFAVVIGMPLSAAGQGSGSGSGSGATKTTTSTSTSKAETEWYEQAKTQVSVPSPASIKLKSNVQIELTISDQTGKGPIEKKTVSMIAASGTWGKIRASGVAGLNERTGLVNVGLNVDARPFVFPDGLVQLELTIGYNPLGPPPVDSARVRPTELNQSMTVSLTDGKPLIVSQAADPVSDRKIIVEVKATILK